MSANKRGIAVRRNIERAFDVYCAAGGNASRTLRALEKEGFRLSRPTLDDWIKEFDFAGRMARADAERQTLEQFERDPRARLLISCLRRIEAYERYFETVTKPYPQADFALTGIMNQVREILKSYPTASTAATEDPRLKAQEILRTEYGIDR